MKALVLAAGQGTRLRPLTLSKPKALVPVAGRPVIEYVLHLLRASEVTEVIINLHYLGEQIRQALGAGEQLGLNLRYSVEDPLLDTGGAIKKVEPWLKGETFVVANADTIADVDLQAVLCAHRRSGALATLLLRPDPMAARYGIIEVDKDNWIRRFLGQPETFCSALEPLMFAGLQVLEPAIFKYMPRLEPFGITRETYPALLAAGEPLLGFRFEGFWAAIDRPEDITRAERYLAELGKLRFLRGPA